MKQVKCPFCGYRMPIFYEIDAKAEKIFTTCKGKNCKKRFEIKVDK